MSVRRRAVIRRRTARRRGSRNADSRRKRFFQFEFHINQFLSVLCNIIISVAHAKMKRNNLKFRARVRRRENLAMRCFFDKITNLPHKKFEKKTFLFSGNML
jgi:hypothetical protein